MPTSGSTDFTLVLNQITEEAFDLCGIGSEGEAISADQYARAKRSLNLIIKTLGTKEHLWLRTERTLTLVAGQAGYTLTPKPMRVLDVRRRLTLGGIDTTLTEWSRSQYLEQSNKSVSSIPVAFYYDPQRDDGTLYLWPAPSAATVTQMGVRLTYLRRMDDFDGSADEADMPQEWLQTLAYALACELALKYGIDPRIRAAIDQRAASLMAALESFDTEPASLFLQPEPNWQGGWNGRG